MSSCCYGGVIRMNPEIEEKDGDPMFDGGYPYNMPKVYLAGVGEQYFPQFCFDWYDDSVVIVRDKHIVKYTKSSFVELLAKNENGDIIWMDGRTAPYSGCWAGEYLDEERGAEEYTVTEYDLGTLKKKKYKVVLEGTFDMDKTDSWHIKRYVDEDTFAMINENVKEDVEVEVLQPDPDGFHF